ncbi:MAG: hypothetical protein M0Z77_10340 [Thermoplasmatales archaeon]|nr:hypothetical protein [Candidatus Thermoplasmatota archaeon]MCL6003350.1 hypothetical protein [Candidatus Thermoplasmatota archaeon]MDA8056025.1 hypothetical protein [Thermoplasmatales archaeon]
MGKLNLRYLPRRLKVTSRYNFSTPVRSITDRDYDYNRNSTSRLELQDYVSNLVVYYGAEELASLLRINGYLRELKEKVGNFIKPALNSPVRILALRLDEEAYSVLSKKEDVEQLIRTLAYVQEPLGTISLPYFSSDAVSVKNLYSDFTSQYADSNPVIWLRIDENPDSFKKRVDQIKGLIKGGRLKLVGIHYSEYEVGNVNYDYLYRNLHDLDVLMLLEGVERKDADSKLSGLHIFPFASFDAISPFRAPPKVGYQGYSIDKPTGNFFVRKDVTLRTLKEIEDIDNFFSKYKNSPAYDLVTKMRELGLEKIDEKDIATKRKFRQFNAFSYAHQAMEGGLEMKTISDSIEKGEASNYLSSKTILDKKVKQIFPKK